MDIITFAQKLAVLGQSGHCNRKLNQVVYKQDVFLIVLEDQKSMTKLWADLTSGGGPLLHR
jgi:hypothetical protein